MCGIAGFMRADTGGAADAAWAGRERMLERFADALAHRGPDGSGRYVDDHVAMVQTRLAVIDLETGDQPMFATSDSGGRLVLAANAEIYNYVELRAAMPEADFQTRSDCETALHLYKQCGPDFANGLRGMYAIAYATSARTAVREAWCWRAIPSASSRSTTCNRGRASRSPPSRKR